MLNYEKNFFELLPLELIYIITYNLNDDDIINLSIYLTKNNKNNKNIRFKLNCYYTMKDYNKLKDNYYIYKIKYFNDFIDNLPKNLTHLTFNPKVKCVKRLWQ